MKKRVLFLFIFLAGILSFNLVFALPVLELNKQDFQPGETLLGKITGNFEESITKNNIHFFIGPREVSPEFDIIFYNNTYFLYAYLTEKGNYSLNINHILYRETELKDINLQKDIYVNEKLLITQQEINDSGNISYINQTDKQLLSIQPGFIFTISDAEISLTNLGSILLNLSYKFENISKKISLSPQEFRKLILNPTKEFSYLEIDTYEKFFIPIIYTPLTTEETGALIKPSEFSLDLEIKVSNRTIKTIQLFNFADKNITKIKISENLSILDVEKEIKQINARGVYNLTLEFSSEYSGIFSDNLIINYSEGVLIIPIKIIVSSTGNISVYQSKSCSDLKGNICSLGQSCNGTESIAQDGFCCAGNCYLIPAIKESSSGSYGWIIGLILFLVVGAGAFFLYKKYQKTTGEKPEEKLEKTAKLYEKRVSGSLTKE